MAVHIPLTEEARWEAKNLMLATKNLLKPATGQPVTRPDKDIAWGCFYMTTVVEPADGKVKTFGAAEQAIYLYQTGQLDIREKIRTRVKPGEPLMETNVGRVILNRLFPKEIGFRNEAIGTKQLGEIVRTTIELRGFERTARFLDEVKNTGFEYITKSGFSYGIGDLPPLAKGTIISEGEARAKEIEDQYKEGLLTKKERYSQIIKVWSDVKDKIQRLSKDSLDKTGTVSSMIDSGARGSVSQLTTVVGMKGLVSNPAGDIIELPIKASFREGLDVLEYFIASHGTRKGLTDTALRTANAGYLTRRLVDVSQDVIITQEDCGDAEGVTLTAAECEEIGEPLLTRLLGRVLLKDLKDVEKETILKKGTLITEDHVREIAKHTVDTAVVRSVLTCKLRRGLCQKCYGYDLAHNDMVKMGTAVGIIAAQSIGEPGTQLTMRTFHSGGVAAADITQGLPRVEELFEARTPKRKAILVEVPGVVKIVEGEKRILQTSTGQKLVDTSAAQKKVLITHTAVQESAHPFLKKDIVKVKDGQKVKEGEALIEHASGEETLASHKGVIRMAEKKVVLIYEAPATWEVEIPAGYHVLVKDGQEVVVGDQITEGQFDLQELFRLRGREAVMRYLLKEVLSIYASQGQKVNAKHIEIIVRQMFSRVYVKEAGDTDLLPGQVVERTRADEENESIIAKGKATPAEMAPLFMGITKVALSTESFLSAASFQETARVLINAAVTGKIDRLEGLKENVIIGRLTPSGTGFGVDHAALAAEEDAREAARRAEIAARRTEQYGTAETPQA
jgi:DNA-directed RNA polymerase subunit beta'